MKRTVYGLIGLSMLLSLATTATASVSIGINLPSVSIGINMPVFPHLVPVPGYPVYYAPQVNANYFFYDGLYWVYQNDEWYASSWYNGPWMLVQPEVIPVFVLRIPVRYYRRPPLYFSNWRSDASPRWGDHWGHDWQQHRSGWDRWERSAAPPPAPLPAYQREYAGDRYPRQVEQQQSLQRQKYGYQPREAVVRQHYEPQQQSMPQAPRDTRSQAPQQNRLERPQQERVQPSQRREEYGAQSAPQTQDRRQPPEPQEFKPRRADEQHPDKNAKHAPGRGPEWERSRQHEE